MVDPLAMVVPFAILAVCRELDWVGFLVVCFLYKTNPNPTKKLCAVGKSGRNATFSLIFPWVGLTLGWGVRRFHNNIDTFPNPTEFGISQTPC